jgi:hypothetical protein
LSGDIAENSVNLAAKQRKRSNRDYGYQSDNQCVFRKTLSLLIPKHFIE